MKQYNGDTWAVLPLTLACSFNFVVNQISGTTPPDRQLEKLKHSRDYKAARHLLTLCVEDVFTNILQSRQCYTLQEKKSSFLFQWSPHTVGWSEETSYGCCGYVSSSAYPIQNGLIHHLIAVIVLWGFVSGVPKSEWSTTHWFRHTWEY